MRTSVGFGNRSVTRLLAASSLAAGALWWPGPAAVATPAPARAAQPSDPNGDGLRFEALTVYRLDPAAATIHVSIDITVTNEQPDEYGRYYISRAYFPRLPIPTLSEAVNLGAAKNDGEVLSVALEPTESAAISIASVDLSPDLYYQDTQILRLTYDLPNQAPRSPSITRINAGFAAMVAIAIGDPTLASVQYIVPEGFDITVEGTADTLRREDREGEIVYSASAIADPDAWNAIVVAHDDDALMRRVVTVSGSDVEVLAWPEDAEWATFVETQVRDGLPMLEELVGRPVPLTDLRIIETVTPYVFGYAGWYEPRNQTVEIGDELNAHVILHELSHMWFNDRILSQRWIGEAFAEEYATRALERLGQPLESPSPVDDRDPGAIRLNVWSDPLLSEDISEEQETYGYNTSWLVLRSVTDEITIDRLAGVTSAMVDRTIAYPGDPEPERWAGATDWRRLLDLLQNVGGSTTAEGLFVQYVLTDAELPALAERAAAREAFAALVAAGEGWTPPLGVREAMGHWDFAAAHTRIGHATAILGLRPQLAATLAPLGVAVPPALEEAYERSDDLNELEATANRYLTVAGTLVEADAVVDRDDGFWGAIGLLGSDPEGQVRQAGDQFLNGHLDAAVATAGSAAELVTGAETEGQRRVGAVGAALLILLTTCFALRLRRQAKPSTAGRSAWSDTTWAASGTPPSPGSSNTPV